jgi:hypothetical protein
MDDTEIEYLAAHPGQDSALGFEPFAEGAVRRY